MPQPSNLQTVVGVDFSVKSDETGYVIYNTKTGRIIHADKVKTSCCTATNHQRALLWISERTVFMHPSEYADKAKEFAVYPKTAVSYPFLGLAGEGGELLAAITVIGIRTVNRNDVLKELGDVCWYFAEICRVTKIDFAEVVGLDSQHDLDAIDPFTALPTAIGTICELAKKSLRDENGEWGPERKAKLESALRHLGHVVLCCCRRYGWGISDVLATNIQKLSDRRDRNKLKGDGDHR